jgi:hypothetical protein
MTATLRNQEFSAAVGANLFKTGLARSVQFSLRHLHLVVAARFGFHLL